MKIAFICDTHLPNNEKSAQYVYFTEIIKRMREDNIKTVISVGDITAFGQKEIFERYLSDLSCFDHHFVIGNAEGMGIAATYGSINVDIERLSMTAVDGYTEVTFDVFRTDAPVNHGNSGGGAFNLSGELVGIVNAKQVDEAIDNMGYMLPANIACSVADSIIYYCDNTANIYPKRLLFGMMVKTVPAGTRFNPETGELERIEELVIDSVSYGTLAYGRIYAGDKIVSIEIDGKLYTADRMYKITIAAFDARPGSVLKVNVIRGGVPVSVTFDISASVLSEAN